MNIYVFGTRGFPGIQGGVEKHCECLYSSMPSAVLSTVFRRKPFVLQKEKRFSESIRFIDLPSTKIKGFEAFFHSFLSAFYCLFKRPSIVHVHNIGPGLFIPILKIFKIKTVLTYHSANYEHDKWGGFAKSLLKVSETIALRCADAIIFVNEQQLEKFSDLVKKKSFHIPNGVVFSPKSLGTNYLEKYSLLPNEYILSVGRITQEKGFDYLIDAFCDISHKDYKLVIVGGVDHQTSFSQSLLKKAEQNGIVMTGFVEGEELSQLYTHAGLFVLPSFNEGFPIVALEAMNYGLGLLLSDIPANRELGLEDCVYFRVGDKLELKDKIQTQLSLGGGKREYDLTEYDWSNIASQTVDVYRTVSLK